MFNKKSEKEVFDESVVIMDDLSKGSVEDIDEGALFKMNKGPLVKVWNQVVQLYEYVKGQNVDTISKAIAIGALLYVILPADAIPDFIPMLGLTDDVGVVTYAITQLNKRNPEWKEYIKSKIKR